jgi:peptide/nickel transport system permease protein
MEIISTVRKLLKMPLACFGLAIIVIVITCAIFAKWIAPYDPSVINDGHYLEGPSGTFLLGTDQIGRDVLSRIIYGSRIALLVSLGAVGLSMVFGVPIGLFSGYQRGWIDEVIMRVTDAILSFPSLIIAVGLVAVLGSSLLNVIIAISVANLPWITRIVRSQVLSLREKEFVKAARSIGAKDWRIIISHIWPNCTAAVIVQATLGMAYAILVEAALGFVGIGVQPPTPTWGNMLRYSSGLLAEDPLLSIAPGIAIFVLVLSFNFVGDALRDVLDPKLKGLIQ